MPGARLGRLSQRLRRRDRAHQVRQHAVAVATEIAAVGYTQRETADLLHVTARTLRHWRHHLPIGASTVRLAGRPARRSSLAERSAVLDYLDQYGPGLGLAPLRHAFPQFTRAELEDLLLRYRRVWRARHRQPLHVLEWTTPGAVWAIDYAEAPNPIDGIGAHRLAVRDLASGRQLLWQPLPEATAWSTATALAPLFTLHGPPLVLKQDNGSPFAAGLVQTLLQDCGITPLFSPPYTPRYNGSIEAGIGALKVRSEAHAARHGRAGAWTLDDVVAARLEANVYAQPRGPHGPSPNQSWALRSSIAPQQRLSFRHAVEDHRCTVRDELGLPPNGPWSDAAARNVDRAAIRHALVEHGYLNIARRTIPPLIPRRKEEVVS